MHHPWRDLHPLGWVITAAVVLTALAGIAGAYPRLNGV